ncbi:WD repeat-containing protein [Verticillium alfalfae VaMs.102]|uniref:WD repeat-containing protein n=1 Tax=Verticillium alfalfae (strain VaMs.102 / ATCC MYA-4576 / FGSC 10136) TaxID=526221 RepID=C9SSB6_VERA1|nr:WD repeat-containing protein [Verticillium alfalfae VaMs.102]EEY21681.1 WD repeat-containing protein [Verticillium alfalfae VaMs.102]
MVRPGGLHSICLSAVHCPLLWFPPARAGWRTHCEVSHSGAGPRCEHILMRTNTENNSTTPRLRYPGRPESPAPDVLGHQRHGSDTTPKHAGVAPTDPLRDKKKGVSFLSRLSMRGRKKDDDADDLSELGEPRLDGTDAHVFSSSIGAGGYIPHHKEPPRYIKVRAHHKKTREFNRMFLAQELSTAPQPEDEAELQSSAASTASGKKRPHKTGAVWALEFSKDGQYLAAAGKDQVVRVWSVLSTHEERRQHEEEENASAAAEARLSAPVFRSKPIREFTGHTGEVPGSQLEQEQLPSFLVHGQDSSPVAHEPTGVPLHFSTQGLRHLPDLVTAVAFTPDGKTSIGGVLNGTCLFYDTEGLKLQTQMLVRSSRGKNAKGSKITGIKTLNTQVGTAEVETKVLVTSNDSRIRIYNMKDKMIDAKLKGHENQCSQIHADLSDDAKWVICGSEDKKAFIWSMDPSDPEVKDKVPVEYFNAHSARVSAAIFAPTKTRQRLGASGDPLYDLCNPPPVKLMSLEESLVASQTAPGDAAQPTKQAQGKKPRESAAYVEKSKHYDGNIIVTADQSGSVKVFRQDCAFAKRRHENWETGSSFSRKMVGTSGMVGRSGSIITRTSASSHPQSRRASLTQPAHPTNPGPGNQMNSDRINSWRQGISADSARNSLVGAASMHSERSASPSKLAKATHASPLIARPITTAPESREKTSADAQPLSSGPHPTSPSSSAANSPRMAKRLERDETQTQPPTPSFFIQRAEDDGTVAQPGSPASTYSFWNLGRWRGTSASSRYSTGSANISTNHATTPRSLSATSTIGPSKDSEALTKVKSAASGPLPDSTATAEALDSTLQSPITDQDETFDIELATTGASHVLNGTVDQRDSFVSQLSSDYSSEAVADTLTCHKCGNKNFKIRWLAGKSRMLCSKCGLIAEQGAVEA